MNLVNGIELNDIPEFDHVVSYYQQRFPGKGTGFYSRHDWNRIKKSYELITGESVLDIGIGNGALLNILSRSDRFDRIVGIDIRKHSMLVLPIDAEHYIMNINNLEFGENEFDTITCMEVLEHIEVEDFPTALSNVRKVCKKRLIASFPYNEPHPVWRHDRKGGHRQSFNDEKLARLFPEAFFFLKKRGKGLPWIFVVEDADIKASKFKIRSFDAIKEILK